MATTDCSIYDKLPTLLPWRFVVKHSIPSAIINGCNVTAPPLVLVHLHVHCAYRLTWSDAHDSHAGA